MVGSNLPPTWDVDRIIKLTSRAGAEILMVTTPPNSIRITHYYYAQVRDKEQRDKLSNSQVIQITPPWTQLTTKKKITKILINRKTMNGQILNHLAKEEITKEN